MITRSQLVGMVNFGGHSRSPLMSAEDLIEALSGLHTQRQEPYLMLSATGSINCSRPPSLARHNVIRSLQAEHVRAAATGDDVRVPEGVIM